MSKKYKVLEDCRSGKKNLYARKDDIVKGISEYDTVVIVESISGERFSVSKHQIEEVK